jgi:putative drug exporter of the RND superfamily
VVKRNKLRLLLPLLAIFIWLGVSGVGGQTFAKITDVETNDQSSFLPQSADSTKVANKELSFYNSSTIPTIVLFTSKNDNKLSYGQIGSLLPVADAIKNVSGVTKTPTSVIGPVPSTDGFAAEYLIQVKATTEAPKTVKAIQDAVSKSAPSGLKYYVTGPGGILADLFNAFSGINGILLYVTIGVVFLILLVVYRSIVLPFVVLGTAMFGLTGAIYFVYELALHNIIKLNGQSQGILSILVIGAATDYSLLMIARYKEALHEMESKWDAMRKTLKVVIEPIGASAATVSLALLCLLFSDLNSNKGLGPVGAIGIVFAFLSVMTLLSAILVLLGRNAFWPLKPKVEKKTTARKTFWERVADLVERKPRAIWISCFIVLSLLALGLPQFKASGTSQTDAILGTSQARDGAKVLSKHFPAGTGSPAVIITPDSEADHVLSLLSANSGVTSAIPFMIPGTDYPLVKDGNVLINATLKDQADSSQAEATITNLRAVMRRHSPQTIIGGTTAIMLDTQNTARNDLHKIIPIVLAVIFVILILLLRAITAPVLLIGSVILSFAASLGLSALVFNHLFHFVGSDPSVPLFGFIFLVALGVDYNIFLMTRVREESLKLGTHEGIFKGLSVTGGVITSAGIVLASTFAALSVVPILFLVEIAFIVAAGVLIDTVIVRSLLVPGLAEDIGKRIWWPSKLWRKGKK